MAGVVDSARSALDLQRTHRFTAESADLLEALALTAGALREFDSAARLAGASMTWRVAYDEPVHVHNLNVAEQTLNFVPISAMTFGPRLTSRASG